MLDGPRVWLVVRDLEREVIAEDSADRVFTAVNLLADIAHYRLPDMKLTRRGIAETHNPPVDVSMLRAGLTARDITRGGFVR